MDHDPPVLACTRCWQQAIPSGQMIHRYLAPGDGAPRRMVRSDYGFQADAAILYIFRLLVHLWRSMALAASIQGANNDRRSSVPLDCEGSIIAPVNVRGDNDVLPDRTEGDNAH